MTKPVTIAQYIDAAAPAAQPLLADMLACLREVAPDAEEGIKWGTPTFTQGRILFTFAAQKANVAFFPTPSVIRAFAEALDGFATTKASVKFPLGSPLPRELVKEMASYRLRDVIENDARWM